MVNENIKQIIFNDELYSSIFDLKNIKEGLDFFTSDDAFIQVGTWNYQEGKILDAHYHNTFERKSYITQEVVLVLEGSINYVPKQKRCRISVMIASVFIGIVGCEWSLFKA